jgi:hypothetical protein
MAGYSPPRYAQSPKSVTHGTGAAATHAPAAGAITLDTEGWLRQLPHTMHQYASRFARHGFETVFAVGLMEEEDLMMLGIGSEHTAIIADRLRGPRNLVGRWTPLIMSVPVTVTLQAWLRRLPVDLSQYTAALEEWGYDAVGVVRHITIEDALAIGLSDGHAKVLTHCALHMADLRQQAGELSEKTIEDFLFTMRPPLEHYSKAVRLSGATTPLELANYRWRDVERIVMRRGHKRLLYHYIVAARAHWVDVVRQ